MQFLIYGLVDPRDLLVHYVGKSSSGLNEPRSYAARSAARRSSRRRVYEWVREMREDGCMFEIVVLEKITDPRAPSTACWWTRFRNPTALSDAERWWIAYGRATGWPLTNATEGGEGTVGFRHTEEYRERARQYALASDLGKRSRNPGLAHGTPGMWHRGCRCNTCISERKIYRNASYKRRREKELEAARVRRTANLKEYLEREHSYRNGNRETIRERSRLRRAANPEKYRKLDRLGRQRRVSRIK